MNKNGSNDKKQQPLVRMDAADKAILDILTAQTGESSPRVLHKALTRYKKEMFFERLNKGYNNLRQDTKQWKSEQSDRDVFDKSSGDGLNGLK